MSPFNTVRNRRPVVARSAAARLRKALCGHLLESLEGRQLMSTLAWTGKGANANWSTPGNWAGNKVPGADDIVVFSSAGNTNSTVDAAWSNAHPSGIEGIELVSGYTKTLDFAASTQIGDFGLEASAGAIKIDAGITVSDASQWTIANATVDATAGTLNFNHNAEASFDPGAQSTSFKAVTVDANSYVELGGHALKADNLTVHGTLFAEGPNVTVAGALTISGVGAGFAGSLSVCSFGSISVEMGGKLSTESPITTGSLTLDAASTFEYSDSPIVVTGTVDLGGSTFAVNPYAKENSDVAVIDKTSTGAFTSSFSNLAEGGSVLVGDNRFVATFAAGNGNDLGLEFVHAFPSVYVDSLTQTEGNSGTSDFVITFTRLGDTSESSTAHYETVDATAQSTGVNPDYVAASGDVTFGVGETTKTVTINVNGDTVYEPFETFGVKLSVPQNAVLAGTAIIGLVNDDVAPNPLPVLSINDISQLEGTGNGVTPFVFTVTRTGDLSGESNVEFNVQPGTADTYDYNYINGNAFFKAGEATTTISIAVPADSNLEPDETFQVVLSLPHGATLDPAHTVGTATILNDDSVPTNDISINDVTAKEGNAGITPFVFTVTRSGDISQHLMVGYQLEDGTGTAGIDFIDDFGEIVFNPGQATQTITVGVIANTLKQADRTFGVYIHSGQNVTKNEGLGTIQDDDSNVVPPPTLSINSVTKNEGNSGTTTFGFTITRSGDLSKPSSVLVQTLDGTANSSDYTGINTTVNFAANQASAIVNVSVKGDTTVEGDEKFTVKLSNPTNATITQAIGTGTITNDDKDTGSVAVVKDITDSTKTMLKILGTAANDTIKVDYNSTQGKADVTINGVKKGTFSFTGIIWADALEGSDSITIDSKITRNAFLYGSAGNDTLSCGSGNDFAFGGDGNDKLYGNLGRDILVGGQNSDTISGSDGDDVLIAGRTHYDNDTAALVAFSKEWTRTDRTYAQRVVNMTKGTGYTGGHKLDATTVDSGYNPPDVLTGGGGLDLFFLNLDTTHATHDTITDFANGETKIGVFG